MKVFICGITGNQGSALARSLLSSSITVVGLSRDPTSPAATALTSAGAHILPGSYADSAALAAALAGCDALFLNLLPSFTDPGAERRDGLAILAAVADSSTITHVVYSTAMSVNAPEKLPNLDPDSYIAKMLGEKRFLEGQLKSLTAVPQWTILRPGNFMSNYVGEPAVTRQRDLVQDGVSRTAFARDTRIPQVDMATIAAFARAALLNPEKFDKQEVSVVDEIITLDETLAKLSAATGRKLRAEYMTDEEIEAQKMLNPMIGAQHAMRDLAQFADMEEVKRWGVPLGSFEAYLSREKELVMETYHLTNKTA
ncbi:hypothetical protein PWT90_00814 [Aphanocladium album]|nr:hypothetical protein PWT90_00814 [Aphanocladium album]